MKTSNLSADNFTKILDLEGSTPESVIRSGDTGQRDPALTAVKESVGLNIGFPVVRTDGQLYLAFVSCLLVFFPSLRTK